MSVHRNARIQTTRLITLCSLVTALGVSPLSFAEGTEQSGKKRGPPAEALEACANLSAGEACAFTGRRGEHSGICFAPREEMALACAPEGGPRRRPPGEHEESQSIDE